MCVGRTVQYTVHNIFSPERLRYLYVPRTSSALAGSAAAATLCCPTLLVLSRDVDNALHVRRKPDQLSDQEERFRADIRRRTVRQ